MTALIARCQMRVAVMAHEIIDAHLAPASEASGQREHLEVAAPGPRFASLYSAARRRRAAHREAFYRTLEAYCAKHSVPIVCEDDWRTSRR